MKKEPIALCDSGNQEVDFLEPFARAFHISPGDAYRQGRGAAYDGTVPEIANGCDDLLAPPIAAMMRRPCQPKPAPSPTSTRAWLG